MEKLFRKLGSKTGHSIRKGKWLYKSVLGSQEEAIDAEYYVGKELAIKFSKQTQIDNSPEVKKLINQIGDKLTNRLTNQKRVFNFHGIISPDVNAFALPGGFIFATDSILRLCDYNEDEIAFLLGHEIGHVVKWHIFNRTVANSSLNLIALVSRPGGLVGGLLTRTLNGLMQSSYSRDQELEADQFGVTLMYSAGYNPKAGERLLGRLKENSKSVDSTYNYFASHPPLEIRIKKISEHIEQKFSK